MRKHGALLFLRPSPLGGKAAAPPYRRAARAIVPARCACRRIGALRAPRASRVARNDGRLTPCGAKRRAASAGGLRGAATGALPLSFSPLCGLFRAHRREVARFHLAVCSWRPAAAAAGVRPPFGRPRKPLPTRQHGTAAASGRAGRKSGAPPREARRTKRAARGARRLFSAFPGAAASGKSLLLAPAPASGIPPPLPVGGLVAGGVGRPQPGKTLVARGASPASARRGAPLRGIALACCFRVAPAGGGRSHAVLARAAAQSAAACGGAPLPLPLIRPRRGRVLLVVPWCARAAGRRLAAARGVGLRGARRARAPAGFWAFRPPQLLVVQDRGRACSGVVRVGA